MYLDKTKRAEIYTQFGQNAQDSGTAESQVAQFSFRIAHLTEHLKKNKKDYSTQLSLIQEVQHHPVARDILHVDFQAVSMTEEITASVTVEAVGEADGVKNFGGLFEQSVRAISVRCLPQNLPEIITVDVSALKIGESIHIRDIKLPAGVTIEDNADLTVFIVDAKAFGVEPRFHHARFQYVGIPAALFGVARKCSIVDPQPRIFVDAWYE